jgi:hypothetical protein
MKKALILLMATAVALIMPYVFSMRAPSMAQAPWKSFAQEPGRYLAPTIVPKNVPVQNKTLVATLNNTIQTLQHIKKESDVSKVALEKNITELERELEKLDKINTKKPREASLYNSLSCLIEYLDQLIRSITDPCRGYRSILGKRGVEGFKEIKKMAEIEATLSLRMTLYSKNNLEELMELDDAIALDALIKKAKFTIGALERCLNGQLRFWDIQDYLLSAFAARHLDYELSTSLYYDKISPLLSSIEKLELKFEMGYKDFISYYRGRGVEFDSDDEKFS